MKQCCRFTMTGHCLGIHYIILFVFQWIGGIVAYRKHNIISSFCEEYIRSTSTIISFQVLQRYINVCIKAHNAT